MKILKKIAVWLFALILVSCSNYQEISESDILLINDVMKDAVMARDVGTILSYFADDALIELEMVTSDGIQKIPLTKSDYQTMLETAFNEIDFKSYEVHDIVVNISPDKITAEVTDTVHETMVIGGQEVNQVSREDAVFKLIDGKVLITSLKASAAK